MGEIKIGSQTWTSIPDEVCAEFARLQKIVTEREEVKTVLREEREASRKPPAKKTADE